jgi:hypothetical protein
MANEGVELGSRFDSNGTSAPSTALLEVIHFNSPWVLLLVFSVAFITNSVLTAESSNGRSGPAPLGPGGKPLPRSTKKKEEEEERLRKKRQDFSPLRKLVFYWLSAGLIATFVANGANIVIHALAKRENGWWCGEATTVSCSAS